MLNHNEEPAAADNDEQINSNREFSGSNCSKSSPKPSLGDVNPAADCPMQTPVSLERTDFATGDIQHREIYKPCGSKWCPVCGPKMRAQMFEHCKRKFLELDDVKWVGLTKADGSDEDVKEIWTSCYHRLRYLCEKNDSDLNYFGIRDHDRSEEAHIHVLISAPGVSDLDIRTKWFESGGGIVAYTEDIGTEERLEQALGYCLLRHFQEARRAKSLNERVPEPLRSSRFAFSSREAKQTRREMAQRKAVESEGVASFRDLDEYREWLARYLSDAEDRSVNVADHGEGIAVKWDEEEVVVQFTDGTISDFPTEDVLPGSVETISIDNYTPVGTPSRSQGGSDSGDEESEAGEGSSDWDPTSRSTEYVTTEGMHRVRIYWDEDARRVRRDVLGLARLDEYRKPLKWALPCPVTSGQFAPESGLNPKSLMPPKSKIKKKEVWKPVVGFEEHYSVSNKGRVRREGRGNILQPSLTQSGYPCVSLSVDGEESTHRVHTLVAKAFVGPPPGPIGPKSGDYQVNHKNSVRTDNRPENLEWVTHEENQAHAFQENREAHINEEHGNAGLEWGDIDQIRALSATTDLTYKEIGKKFGITDSRVCQIVKEQAWKPEDRPDDK